MNNPSACHLSINKKKRWLLSGLLKQPFDTEARYEKKSDNDEPNLMPALVVYCKTPLTGQLFKFYDNHGFQLDDGYFNMESIDVQLFNFHDNQDSNDDRLGRQIKKRPVFKRG